MTLVRHRLSQVETQKGEMAERNAARGVVMAGLKGNLEELVKERNSWRWEMEDLESANERMSEESESNSSDAVARRSSEAETLLGLQKMIASL